MEVQKILKENEELRNLNDKYSDAIIYYDNKLEARNYNPFTDPRHKNKKYPNPFVSQKELKENPFLYDDYENPFDNPFIFEISFDNPWSNNDWDCDIFPNPNYHQQHDQPQQKSTEGYYEQLPLCTDVQ